ncbi:MAG: hypothetical protein ABIO60_08620 [Aquaticitalea sp.]
MLVPPPYRFQGSISFNYDGISFNGYDSQLKENVEFNIAKDEITQLYYGYDETFSTFQTRGMGMTWAPIRFTFDSTKFKNETDLYLVLEFNGISSENQNLFEELKIWLS